jgi:hypothetical protein
VELERRGGRQRSGIRKAADVILSRGLGQDTFGTLSVDDSGQLITPVSGGAPTDVSTTTTLAYPNMPGSAPSPAGFNWSPVLANLLGQGVNLAGKVVAPTTTIQRGPNGQVLIQTPASSASGASLLATSAGAGVTSNWLVIAGLAVVAIVAVKMFKG